MEAGLLRYGSSLRDAKEKVFNLKLKLSQAKLDAAAAAAASAPRGLFEEEHLPKKRAIGFFMFIFREDCFLSLLLVIPMYGSSTLFGSPNRIETLGVSISFITKTPLWNVVT